MASSHGTILSQSKTVLEDENQLASTNRTQMRRQRKLLESSFPHDVIEEKTKTVTFTTDADRRRPLRTTDRLTLLRLRPTKRSSVPASFKEHGDVTTMTSLKGCPARKLHGLVTLSDSNVPFKRFTDTNEKSKKGQEELNRKG